MEFVFITNSSPLIAIYPDGRASLLHFARKHWATNLAIQSLSLSSPHPRRHNFFLSFRVKSSPWHHWDHYSGYHYSVTSLQDTEMEMRSQLMWHVAIDELYFNPLSGKVAYSEVPGGDFHRFFFFFLLLHLVTQSVGFVLLLPLVSIFSIVSFWYLILCLGRSSSMLHISS